MNRRYPKEINNFIRENVKGRTTRELTQMVNDKFGISMTESQMKSYKKNHKLKSGTPGGLPKGHPSKKFPAEVGEYIRQNYLGVGNKEMAERLNREFGTSYTAKQLNAYYKNHGLNSGLTGRFEKGHVSVNKGTHPPTVGRMAETQFKKGGLPPNTKPIGYERITKDGYTEVKIAMRPSRSDCNDNFVLKQRLVWEQANGPIPKGYVIIFKDGDKTNCDINNLALISQAENVTMLRRNLRSSDAALTETGVLIARAEVTMRKRKKGKSKRRRNENGYKKQQKCGD